MVDDSLDEILVILISDKYNPSSVIKKPLAIIDDL